MIWITIMISHFCNISEQSCIFAYLGGMEDIFSWRGWLMGLLNG